MKICYIANARIPSKKAHGIQVMKMCEAFALCGHEVTLVVPNRRSSKDDVFAYYGVRPNFAIKKVWTIDTVRYGRLGFWFQQFIFSVMALLYVASKKFDLIYSRDELSLFFLSFFTKKFAWESHMARYSWAVVRILKSSARLVVISGGLKKFYVSKGLLEKNILVAHDAVNLEEFSISTEQEEARRRLDLPLDKKIAMYIGYLKDWKGYDTLLKASEYLKDVVQVTIIGGAEKQISNLQEIYPSVIFLEFQPYRDLPVNQRAADILVIPNTATSEPAALYTSPLKVFAHMASGVPIVASDVPALREVLSEENALFFEPDNPADLAEKIKETLENPKEAMEGAKRARDEVEKYTWIKRAESILSYLSQ